MGKRKVGEQQGQFNLGDQELRTEYGMCYGGTTPTANY